VAAVAAVLLIGGGVLAFGVLSEEVSVSASFTIDPEAATVGDEVTLDASASTVTGADTPVYSWRLSTPEQSDAVLDDPQAVTTSFTPDLPGRYELELEVSAAGTRASRAVVIDAARSEEVSVSASFTVDPEAATVGDEITLDASASTVTGAENLTYSWDFVPPEESGATINALEAETARFTADVRGDYEIGLEVSAREVSDFDTMTVLVEMPTEEVQTEETAEGFGIRLAAPGAVTQNEEFVIRVAITNERPEPTTLTLSSSCLTQIGVYDGPENVRMEGTGRPCLAAITNREFSSGETQESVFDVSAELRMVVGTGGEIPRGTYTIRASPNVRAIGGEEATLPSVEQDLIVF